MKISPIVFKLQSRHKYMTGINIHNVQRAVTPKQVKQELRFLCSAAMMNDNHHYHKLQQQSGKI